MSQTKPYIMAIDQGTTSSRCIIFDASGAIVSMSQRELKQIYEKPGWVAHDPLEIWGSQLGVCIEALVKKSISPTAIAAIGITNQRESTVVWNRHTGKPVYDAICWQCRRTAADCERLEADGFGDVVKEKTGLRLDSYFSATKLKWILENVEGARAAAENGDLLFGTIDTWLIWNLTGGKVHATDHTNASRTMLYNIHEMAWDEDILKKLGIPSGMLPTVKKSSDAYGMTDEMFMGTKIPIGGVVGDQQGALFGQMCFDAGMAKNTYGTGCFLLMNTGAQAISSACGLLTTMAASYGDTIQYALEGSIFIGGAVIQWLRDEVQMIAHAADSEALALSVEDTNGVYLVPAFVGLGTPYWDPYARGILIGLTRGASKAHIVRAAVESMAYQTFDVVRAMSDDSSIQLQCLKVDGGASANQFLMQFQADILGLPVERAAMQETTALGAAYLAGLSVGYFKTIADIMALAKENTTFAPRFEEAERQTRVTKWHRAVERCKGWDE